MRPKTHLLPLILFVALFLFGALPTAIATAQPLEQEATPTVVCTALVEEAEARVKSSCDALGRNQACYGNQTVDVDFRPGSDLVFNESGDTVDLLEVQRVTTAPLDVATQDWGIAVLKAQANLPDALPGQNVTFILFGDTSVDNPTPDMHAMVVSTRIGSVECADAPDSAMLIQSPTGSTVAMNLNGADMTLGSTAYVTAEEDGFLTISIIEGVGTASAFGITQVILPGMQVRLPLGTNDSLHVIGGPSQPQPFNQNAIDRAPLGLLDRDAEPEAVGTASLTPTASVCIPRTDWTFTYIVTVGDTLSGIAQRAGLSTAALASGNCIVNVNRIFVGQALRVPVYVLPPPTAIPVTVTPGTQVPASPTASLSASPPSISPPQCATLTWTTTNAVSATLNGNPVSLNGSQLVCPTVDTTYTLTAVGAQSSTGSSATVYVDTGTPVAICGNEFCETGETSTSCPADCGYTPTCGDNICDSNLGEDYATCPADCG